MDKYEVAQQLRSRTDPASQAAVARLDAGGRWWSSVQVVQVASERRAWSRPEEPYSDLEIIGLEGLLADLAATGHSTLEEATLDYMPPGAGLGDRFLIYLAPGTSEVVACVGVVPAPRPPSPVYQRTEVPDTITAAAAAFSTYQHNSGRPRSFDVTVHRELTRAEAEALHAVWPHRTSGFYSQARSITILGAANVSFRDPRGQLSDGHLLILDIAPDSQLKRHRYGRVDALLLTQSRGVPQLRVGMHFQYEAEESSTS